MKLLSKYCAVLCILLLTGCISGVERESKMIGFNPVIGHDTRADEESIPFPEDRTFEVWATAEDGTTVLAGETVTHGSAGWMTSTPWPQEELLFAAYYPSDLDPEYIPGHGFILKDFAASSEDVEVLIAQESSDSEGTDGIHTLHFEHILSRVDFRVRHSLSGDIDVRAVKVEIKGFALSGDYNVGGDQKWTIDSKDGSIVVYDAGTDEGLTVTDMAQYIGGQYLTIPQHCRAEIVVTFKISMYGGGWVTDQISTGMLDTDWQSGTQYTYTMNLTDTKMTYTTGISSWTSK